MAGSVNALNHTHGPEENVARPSCWAGQNLSSRLEVAAQSHNGCHDDFRGASAGFVVCKHRSCDDAMADLDLGLPRIGWLSNRPRVGVE